MAAAAAPHAVLDAHRAGVDQGAEAYDVNRLFVADHSALANGVGGPNPTNSGQALALRTADVIAQRYFSYNEDRGFLDG